MEDDSRIVREFQRLSVVLFVHRGSLSPNVSFPDIATCAFLRATLMMTKWRKSGHIPPGNTFRTNTLPPAPIQTPRPAAPHYFDPAHLTLSAAPIKTDGDYPAITITTTMAIALRLRPHRGNDIHITLSLRRPLSIRSAITSTDCRSTTLSTISSVGNKTD